MPEYDFEPNETDSVCSNTSLTNKFQLLSNCYCTRNRDFCQRQPTLLEFIIRGISLFIYFVCWIINLWFVVASVSFDVIRSIYRAPKFVRIIAAILAILLIISTALHLVVLTGPTSNSSSISSKGFKSQERNVLSKYAEYEKLSAKKQAEILKTLSAEEQKLFLLLDSLPPDSRSSIKELEKMGITSPEKLTKVLSPSTSKEKNEILAKMSKTERDKFKLLETQIAKSRTPHLRIKVLDKKKPYASHVGNPNEIEPTFKKFTIIVKEDDCGVVYEENKSIEIKKNNIGKLPSLELSLDKILIEDY